MGLPQTIEPFPKGKFKVNFTNALEKINESSLDQLVVTDTIPLSSEANSSKKIRCISLAPTLAEAIKRLNKEESISEMLL